MNATQKAKRRDRRREKRQRERAEKTYKRMSSALEFDNAFNFDTLYNAATTCKCGVMWKKSVQEFMFRVVAQSAQLNEKLHNETYKKRRPYPFLLNERGKMRRISAVHFNDRVVQRALCDNSVVPIVENAIIYDNAASLQGKGTTFARKRFVEKLKHSVRKWDNPYIVIGDFSNYFGSIKSERAFELIEQKYWQLFWAGERVRVRENTTNERVRTRENMSREQNRTRENSTNEQAQERKGATHEGNQECENSTREDTIYHDFHAPTQTSYSDSHAPTPEELTNMPKTAQERAKSLAKLLRVLRQFVCDEACLGLGNQTSQTMAIYYLNTLDHRAGEFGFYGRYMDDFYCICKTKERAEEMLDFMESGAVRLGLTLNPHKCAIMNVLRSQIPFLKRVYHFEGEGCGRQHAGRKTTRKNCATQPTPARHRKVKLITRMNTKALRHTRNHLKSVRKMVLAGKLPAADLSMVVNSVYANTLTLTHPTRIQNKILREAGMLFLPEPDKEHKDEKHEDKYQNHVDRKG